MIEFNCSQCGRQIRVIDEAEGKKGKCPDCGVVVQVPGIVSKVPHEPTSDQSHNNDSIRQPIGDTSIQRNPTSTQEAEKSVAVDLGPAKIDQSIKTIMGVGGIGLFMLGLSPLFRWINFGGGGVTGISGDGKIVLGATALAIIIYATAVFTRKQLSTILLLVGAWGTVSLFWMGGLIWKVGSIFDSPEIKDNPFAAIIATQVSPGAGLYLGLIGGLIISCTLGFLAFQRLKSRGLQWLFYAFQLCALIMGMFVAIVVGPEHPAADTHQTASSENPTSLFSFADTDTSETKKPDNEQAIKEIHQLYEKLVDDKRNILKKFIVERSCFRKINSGFSPKNVIELSVRNNTDRTVSRAYFHAVLLTPGRELPWVDDEFNYQITGGIEPGESATWNLRPNMFGAWGSAPDDRDDLILIVRPVQLDGADDKSLSGERFTEHDAERLRTLLDETNYDEAFEVINALNAHDEVLLLWQDSAVRDAVRSETEYLREIKARFESAQKSLAQFVIEHSRFYFSKDRFSSDPIIELAVNNGTDKTVSRFYCRGVLSSPGRDTPWVDDTFNYSVRGGIQPGETKQFSLAPNMFGPWGQAPKDRQDMTFEVTVYRIDDSNGEELYPAEWSDEYENRLSVLETINFANGG